MPLSEHEQRMLDQLEQQLSAEDPKFYTAMNKKSSPRLSPLRVTLGAIALVAGLGAMVWAVSSGLTWVGAAAFLVMLAGVLYALSAPRTGQSAAAGKPASVSAGRAQKPVKSKGSLSDRLEDRWDRRQRGEM